VFPRSWDSLTTKARDVLAAYGAVASWVPSLPIRIEDIIERHFDLRILWDSIDEPPGEHILAMLVPERRTIVLNERHVDDIFETVGPLHFTLAHELGHWLFDAVSPDQGTLFDASGEPVFCRGPRTIDEAASIREGNADRFAASLLMPATLLPLNDLVGLDYNELREAAHSYGVSTQALRVRVDQLTRAPVHQQLDLS